MLQFMRTAAFLLPSVILVFSSLYYYRAMTREHRRVIGTLKEHLIFEGKYKKVLLSQLVSHGEEKTELLKTERYDEEDILLGSLSA